MGLKNIDIESAMRTVADRRIEQAMAEGKFDNLPGAGKPLDLDPAPAEENARLLWWALRILRNAGYVPDEVQIRRQIEEMQAELDKESDPQRKSKLGEKLNALIRRLNTLGTNAMNAAGPHAPR